MREQHNKQGPGKPRNWSLSESGDWIRKNGPEKEAGKRQADGHISPEDKAEQKKTRSSSSRSPSPSK